MNKKVLAALLITVAIAASCSETSLNETNAVVGAENKEEAKVQMIGSEHTKKLLAEQKDVVILDVRTPDEYNDGHLQHAQLVDYNLPDFSERLKTLDRSKPYLLYCAVGGRSGSAAQMMINLGFKQVYDANEGFLALKSAGIPTE